MQNKPSKSIDADKLLKGFDEQVEAVRQDCDKVIKQAEEFLQRKQLNNKKSSNDTI